MLIGVPKEIKTHEYRVGLVPASVRELVHNGHRVLVETGAGAGIGFDDKAYRAAGARIAPGSAEVFAKADMIVKVKEPQPKECRMLRRGQLLFTYLHLAPDPASFPPCSRGPPAMTPRHLFPLLSLALLPAAANAQAPTPADPAKDRAAILAMQGEYTTIGDSGMFYFAGRVGHGRISLV